MDTVHTKMSVTIECVRFAGLTVVLLKSHVFWNIPMCQLLHPAKVQSLHSARTLITTLQLQCVIPQRTQIVIDTAARTSGLAIMLNSYPIYFPISYNGFRTAAPIAVLGYSLGYPGFKSQQGQKIFPFSSLPASYSMGNLMPRIRISGTSHLLPLHALRE